jgi:hypothetical protein
MWHTKSIWINLQDEALEANAKTSLITHQTSVAYKLISLPTKSYKFDVESHSLGHVLDSCFLN